MDRKTLPVCYDSKFHGGKGRALCLRRIKSTRREIIWRRVQIVFKFHTSFERSRNDGDTPSRESRAIDQNQPRSFQF